MAVFEPLFNVQTDVFVHRTVVTRHQVTKEGPQLLDNGLGHLSRVRKHQGRGVGADEVGNGLDVVFKNLHHRKVAKFGVGDEDVQIQFP